MLNQVVVIGRLVADPELRQTPSGKSVASFRLAVDRDWVPQGGKREADFFSVTIWGTVAENVAQHQRKGKLVCVAGRLQSRTYEGKDGQKRSVVEIVGERVQYLSPKDDSGDRGNGRSSAARGGSGQQSEDYGEEPPDDEAPF